MCIYIYIYIYMCVCVCVCCRSKERIKIYSKLRRSKKDLYFFKFILFLHTCYMCMFPACCFRQRAYMAQSLVNGKSMRPQLTRVPSLKVF